ncbi:DUF5995 family protein [Mucilaginibacter gynuensis]
MMLPATINEVLSSLDAIIADCRQRNSRVGYFAVLYRQMTLAVKNGMTNKAFEDAARMEKFDVIFANRYISAWDAYKNKKPCSNSWCAAFDACDTGNLIVLQHLLLGINTHINLDLSIAAAECCPGDSIKGLEKDFNKINEVIAVLSNNIQEKLSQIWFPLRFLTKISNKREEAVLNFSISAARKAAWANALLLAYEDAHTKTQHIKLIDDNVFLIAQRVIKPGFFVSFLLKPVLMMESKDVKGLIDVLQKEDAKAMLIAK